MPPQGCDLGAPGDKLYSSATRKTYPEWPGCANSSLSLNLVIKINTTLVIFLLFVFLCCLDVYKAKSLKFRLLKSFDGQTYIDFSIVPCCVHLIHHVVYFKDCKSCGRVLLV